MPLAIGHLLGYHVTDVIILRLAGAATIGYAAMGALELRSCDWAEMRLPVLMAMVPDYSPRSPVSSKVVRFYCW